MLRAIVIVLILASAAAAAIFLYPAWRLRFGHVDFQSLNGADRMTLARWRREASLRAAFKSAGVTYPPEAIFLRALKREARLELWARTGATPFQLIRSYPITYSCGEPGPKRREGDRQVPEGFYEIDRFNPESNFHLSLGLNYPNASDRLRSDQAQPGSDIFIHGGDGSIGCIPIGDENIEEVFLAAWDARAHGQEKIEVHVFPAVMQGPAWAKFVQEQSASKPALRELLGRAPTGLRCVRGNAAAAGRNGGR